MLLYGIKDFSVDDRLMCVFKDKGILRGILDSFFQLVRLGISYRNNFVLSAVDRHGRCAEKIPSEKICVVI